MKPSGHIAISALAGIAFWFYSKSFGYSLVTFVSGVLIDADHFFDYFMNYGFTANFAVIYNACADEKLDKLYLLLHCYEFVIIAWVMVILSSAGLFWQAIAVGMTQHLLLDQYTNRVNPLFYFFIFRLKRGFKKEYLVNI